MKRVAASLLALLLAACSSAPPAPDWQLDAHGALERGIEAWLSGRTRVAQAEFARARTELARTGQAALLARLALARCAAQVASLEWGPCTDYEPLAPDAGAAERAYAAYLEGRAAPADAPLLPPQHRPFVSAPPGAGALAAVEDPLARLVAAAVLLRSGRAEPQVLALAVDTASAQGWRRPLLAWLELQRRRAEQAGDTEAAARLQRRITLVGGAAP